MNDVTVAPSGGGAPSAAPSSPAPASHEVQINQSPTSSPNPVGAQAPNKPVGDLEGSKHRPQSRSETIRESLKAAFDRAENPPPKGAKPAERPAPKAAEARKGHNQPPEDTPAEKFDLKKRPTDQPSAAAEPQPRDRGRFAPKQPQDATNQAGNVATNQAGNVAPAQQQPQKLPPHAPFAEPLPRMAESAKRDWAVTPETVRGDVHRMHSEFSKAANYYKATHEAFKPIERFHKMAREHGTTLEAALENYVGVEQKLRSDPIGALDLIVHNLGLTDPQSGRRINLRDVAYHVLNQTPEQLKQVQQGNMQQAAAQQIGALHQKIEGLENTLQQWQTQQKFTYTRSAVDQFAATHPRFDELGELIKSEIQLGFDIETAYRRAELLSPATHAAQTRTTSAQTRPVDRSISGAPGVAPSNGASRRPKDASPTPRAAVQNAISRLNGAH